MSGLKNLTKGQIVKLKNKQNTATCYLQEIHFRFKDAIDWKENHGKDMSCKWQPQESWSAHNKIRQNIL